MKSFGKKLTVSVLSLILAVMTSSLVLPTKTFAATSDPNIIPLSNDTFDSEAGLRADAPTVDQNTNSQGQVASSNTPRPAPERKGCSLLPPNVDGCVASLVNLGMWLVSWFLYLAGYVFDLSMHFTLNISDLMTRVPAVDIGWKIFRDLANIFFIFILLWIAISTILGFNSGKTKELIVHLVVIALLMNFSLFITKAIVDSSNIIALHFYNLIVTSNPTGTLAYTVPQNSMSGAFMEGLKIQTIYDGSAIGEAGGETRQGFWSAVGNRIVDVAKATAAGSVVGPVSGIVAGGAALVGGNVIDWGKIILIGLFGSALMLIAAYVFVVGAVLMIVRAVVLMFVMMLSPLAFLAFAMPFAEKYAEPWKESLIKQVIFAPAFMALSYVVVKTIQSPAFKGVVSVSVGNASLASAFTTGSGGGIAMIVNFLLVIGLMLGCILVAKKLEVHGLEFAKAVGAKGAMWIASGRFITTTAGVIGYGFRGVGRSMQGLSEIPSTLGDWKDKAKGGLDKTRNTLQNLPNTLQGAKGKLGQMAGGAAAGIQAGLQNVPKNLKSLQQFAQQAGTLKQKAATVGNYIGQKTSVATGKLSEMGKKVNAFGENINRGALGLAEKFNAVELKKRFDNSPLGKTTLGNFLSEQTFGRLLHAKFGGEESLEEAHHKDEEQESREFDVDRQKEAIKASKETRRLKEEMRRMRMALKALKNDSDASPNDATKKQTYETAQSEYDATQKIYFEEVAKIERAMNKQSNKGFLSMNKELYHDPEIMQHVSFAKMQALLKDEHTLNNEQKDEAMKARWEEPHEMFKEYRDDFNDWEKEKAAALVVIADGNATSAQRTAAESKLTKLEKSQPQLDQTTRRMVRNIRNVAEFEALETYFPEMFKNERFVERILQGSIDQIRASDVFTSVGKEGIREAKSVSVWNAGKRILGLDPAEEEKLPRLEQDRRRGELDKAYKKDPFGFIAKLKADDAANVNGRNDRYALHLMGKRDIEPALLGKTTEEIAKMPGRIWEMTGILDQFDSGRGYAFKPKDEGDKIPVIEHIITRWNQKDSSGKRAIGAANMNFLWEMVNRNLSSFTNLSGLKEKPEMWKGLQEIISHLSEEKRAILKLDEGDGDYGKLKKEMEERWVRERKAKESGDVNTDEDDFTI